MGLLAKANTYLEQQQKLQQAAEEATQKNAEQFTPTQTAPAPAVKLTAANVTATTKTGKKPFRPKLRKLAAGIFMSLALHTVAPLHLARTDNAIKPMFDGKIARQKIYHQDTTPVQPTLVDIAPTANLDKILGDFTDQLHQSNVSAQDRDDLARMLYGEAGRGTDPFEVLHTVLNRVASPLFKGTLHDILTAENQYLGYRPSNPVDPKLRQLVDFVVDEWEEHGCQKVDGCNHYYFVTGIPNVCNKFEISEDPQGRWVSATNKKYAPMQHYCDVAADQAARFNAAYEHEHSL